MDSWVERIGATVTVNGVSALLIATDPTTGTLDVEVEDDLGVGPFDVVQLIHSPPISRSWAAVRTVGDGWVQLGRPTHDETDRRQYPRRELELPVTVWWPGTSVETVGRTLDVSVGGFAAALDHPPPEGVDVVVRIDGSYQPLLAVARCIAVHDRQAHFAYTDIGAQESEMARHLVLTRPARTWDGTSTDAVLWSSVGAQPVTAKPTRIACVVSGAEHCPARKEHVVLKINDALLRARVVTVAGGVVRLAWLE
ncbi:PilZ domain-containing protein [Krasilnikovia sp. MM14-A1259]|uniref:PilZ domain-containing protein n=1 Tax=Krasilnikovia sp. MM14-A1259 TaxID=3373539 RepID=UPI00399D17A2